MDHVAIVRGRTYLSWVKRSAVALLLALGLGCGGTPDSAPDAGAEDATTDSPADPSFGDGLAPDAPWVRTWDGGCMPSCPITMPALGGACTGPRACEYEADGGATRSAVCVNGAWTLGSQDGNWPAASTCPAAPQDAVDASCNEWGSRCDFPDASCGCLADDGGTWLCRPKLVACPARPRIGAPCGSTVMDCFDPLARCSATGPTRYTCWCGQWEDLAGFNGPPPVPHTCD